LTFPPDLDDDEVVVPELISSAPPSPPFASPTVSIIIPELPADDNPVLIAIDPLVSTVLDPVPRDIEPLTPSGPLSTATVPELELALDPDSILIEPPSASLSLAASPASKFNDPPL
jgi:hypothetical protein